MSELKVTFDEIRTQVSIVLDFNKGYTKQEVTIRRLTTAPFTRFT